MEQVFFNGVGVYPFPNRKTLLHFIGNKKGILVAINAEKIMNATPQIRDVINDNIGYADGIGAVLALKRRGIKTAVKIPGCELWLDIVKAGYKNKVFYLVGGKQEVIEATVDKLKSEYPEINIIGYRNGYITSESERKALICDVVEKKPDVVFVAMGSPKQELLMMDMQKVHEAIYMGLGGSFDVYMGNVKRAPKYFVDMGLEWFYRLLRQPSRIKRQIIMFRYILLLYLNKI